PSHDLPSSTLLCFLMTLTPPTSTLFPYTTLFRSPTGLHLPVLLLLMTHVSWSLSCSMSQSRARTQMVPVDSPPHRCLVILQPGCSTAITFRLRPKENDG